MLPAAVLGYLSWRAIERERAGSLEQLRESYGQLGALAARQIDSQLRNMESRWIGSFDDLMSAPHGPTVEQVVEARGKEPLIADYFLLAAPGRILYPPIAPDELDLVQEAPDQSTAKSEHDEFAGLAARGEELEYQAGDLKAALAVYREILRRVESPRLRAMAESYVGRVQLKANDPTGALRTFRGLLRRYPNERDLNRMYLRFLAQYQIAVSLEELWRHPEALDVLLELNRDLIGRSDAITQAQYAYFSDLIKTTAPPIVNRLDQPDRTVYTQAFKALGEQNKKRISEKHFVHLLASELSEMTFKRKRFTSRTQYLSARAEGDPFLLAYRALPDAGQNFATGILAARIDLPELQSELFAALRNLDSDTQGAVAILGPGGEAVIGAEAAKGTLMATQDLLPPFDFWQVGIYLGDVPTAMQRLDLARTLWLWLVCLMLLSILFGGYWFIVRARRQSLLSRAQTTFVSNVTHELRTPLTSIKMFAELLEIQMAESKGAAPARFPTNAGQYLGLIQSECDRLGRLIDRVILFSRMERRAEPYHFVPRDVAEVVTECVNSFRPHADSHAFRLELEVEKPLPEVSLDADAFSQVMLNLLTNAVQYSLREKEIRVRVAPAEGGVTVSVADRGAGIRPRDVYRVFDKFYSTWRRMDSRKQGGLGLGLTISREIARAHGGDIQVQSELGRGSTFTVYLPAHAPAPARGVGVADPPEPRAVDVPALGRLGGGHA